MLIDSTISALAIVFDPERFAIISLGVFLGLIIGVLPGIGGLAGMALLISFTYAMDPHTALAFLIGMWAVTATSDTVPAILFGVPGAIGSASTVLDGYPMARRGGPRFWRVLYRLGPRRVVWRYTASDLVSGAAPVHVGDRLAGIARRVRARPNPRCIHQPGRRAQRPRYRPLRRADATIGNEAQTGALRWTLGTMYLWDGIPIETIALGLFALPELVDMAIARKSISSDYRGGLIREQLRGVRDVMRNWKLVIHSSSIGVLLGLIPGTDMSFGRDTSRENR